MKILIFGASGATGHELVKQALHLGHTVTAFVRNPLKLAITHRALRVVQGNITAYEQVAAAVAGQDAVLSALGASNPFKYDQSLSDGVLNILKAMEWHHINMLIYMSFAGVKESRSNAGFLIKHIAPALLSAEIKGHENREYSIRRSALQWIIVRPPTLTNGKHRAHFRYGENITPKGFPVLISRADVADCMLRLLADKSFAGKKPLILY